MADSKTTSVGGGSVRIHPWVTYVLAVLLVGGSLLLLITSPNAAEEVAKSREMAAARKFFERNPEVELSGRLAHWIGSEYVREVRAEHEKRRERGGVAVLSKRMRDKSQKRFDVIQRDAFASLQQLPSWRLGVIDGQTPVRNTFAHLIVYESVVALAISMAFLMLLAICLEGAWGSLLFGGFTLLLPFVTTTAYTAFYGDRGVPWTGASAVVAAMLGAYLVRSFKGFAIPFYLLIPAWAVCEYLLARDIPIDHFDPSPLVVHGLSFAFGAGIAAIIWALSLEEKFFPQGKDSPDLISNPVLEQALQERSAGNVDAAFAMLQTELQQSPDNHDVALALWQVSSGSDRAGRAVPALLGAIRQALRNSRREEACSLWTSMASELGEPDAEATLLVRIGEALVGEEQHEPGLAAMAKAVDGPKALSSVLAMRVVRSARDLDHDLAGRAATVALIDDQLGGSERAAMQSVVDAAAARPAPEAAAAAAPQAAPVAEEVPEPLAAPEESVPDPDPYQDPHALAAESFAELEQGESLAAEDPETWNDPGVVQDLSAELENDQGFDWSGLQDEDEEESTAPEQTVDTSMDLGATATAAPAEDTGARKDISETTETLEPKVPAPPAPTPEPIAVPVPAPSPEPAPEAPAVAPAVADASSISQDTAETDAAAMIADSRRTLRARMAVPVALDDEGLSVEVEGGSKTVLPYARIEAVAAGAVQGLAARPVLVVDVVLNWLATPDEPLKLIRIRSDSFDPRSIVAGGSALESLRAMLDELINRSGATPLPNRSAALGNPFESFADVATYDRTVLMAE